MSWWSRPGNCVIVPFVIFILLFSIEILLVQHMSKDIQHMSKRICFRRDTSISTTPKQNSVRRFASGSHTKKRSGLTYSEFSGNEIFPVEPVAKKDKVTIALSLCSKRLEQGMTLIKSVIVFSPNVHVDFRIFYDSKTKNGLSIGLRRLKDLAIRFGVTLDFTLYPASYPDDKGIPKPWSKLFKPCAAQRLFLPGLLPDVDSLIYLDSDTLLLTDIRDLWAYFSRMNSTQLAGMTNHDELNGLGGYSHLSGNRIPYYGFRGVQSGVMLQNLTRMREVQFEKYMAPIYAKYDRRIDGDQCILNVYFSMKPEQMYLLPCDVNYIVTHCDPKYMRGKCIVAEKFGASVLHAADRRFIDKGENRGTFFRNMYEVLLQANLETDTTTKIALRLQLAFKRIIPWTPCWDLTERILFKLNKYIE